MGLATILALLALFIAFVALWLVSDVLKKVETQNEKFVRAHIATVREELRGLDTTLTKATRAIKALEEHVSGTDGRISDHTKRLDEVGARFAKLAEDLETLDQSVPQRYRVRVVTKKEADKPAPRPKPTVQ